MLEDRRLLAAYLVTNPGDDITGTTPNQLRWAINQVNAGAGTGDTINFSLGAPGTSQTINLSAALPAITKPVVINGWSQNGGTPGVMIGINGGGLTGDGLVFNTGGSTVGGLAVYNFHGNGIDLNNTSGSGDGIFNCNIGTDTTGTATGLGNTGDGVLITGGGDTVGGVSTYGNVISGNGGYGAHLTGAAAQGNIVTGSDIGVNATGTTALPNVGGGILLDAGATNNTIGGPNGSGWGAGLGTGNNTVGGVSGTESGGGTGNNSIGGGYGTSSATGNVISGNTGAGVELSGSTASGNTIIGNLIGTDYSGSTAIGNGSDGITVASAPSNTIGGINSGQANVISGNAGNGITITGDTATGNLVSVNLIGTNEAGTAALGNENDGVYVASSNNTVGTPDGTDPSEGIVPTVISGNGNSGIDLAGANNTVGSCYIGTDPSGLVTLGNEGDGIDVEGDNNSVGADLVMFTPLPRRIISGNDGNGIDKNGATKLDIWYCYIGVDSTGIRAKPNGGSGVVLFDGSQNIVEENVISGNTKTGLSLSEENDDKVLNNIIGLGSDGSTILDKTNATGLTLVGSPFGLATDNTIGAVGAGNTISGNVGAGVSISLATKTVIKANYIGTDGGGARQRANGGVGLSLGALANYNTIGGSGSGEGNVISGNDQDGISLSDITTRNNLVEGNYIGTDKNGTAKLGNSGNGITIVGENNIIGAPLTGSGGLGAGNIVSANARDGILVEGEDGTGNAILGNYVGVGKDGTTPLGNSNNGVDLLNGANSNLIGGIIGVDGNIISGNGSGPNVGANNGVTIGNSCSNNAIFNNFIGTDQSGLVAVGNWGDGVYFDPNAGAGNSIGGAAELGNLISGNGNAVAPASMGFGIDFNNVATTEDWNFIGVDANGTQGTDIKNRNGGVANGKQGVNDVLQK